MAVLLCMFRRRSVGRFLLSAACHGCQPVRYGCGQVGHVPSQQAFPAPDTLFFHNGAQDRYAQFPGHIRFQTDGRIQEPRHDQQKKHERGTDGSPHEGIFTSVVPDGAALQGGVPDRTDRADAHLFRDDLRIDLGQFVGNIQRRFGPGRPDGYMHDPGPLLGLHRDGGPEPGQTPVQMQLVNDLLQDTVRSDHAGIGIDQDFLRCLLRDDHILLFTFFGKEHLPLPAVDQKIHIR